MSTEDNTTNVAAPENAEPATENISTTKVAATESISTGAGGSPQSAATAVASQREDDEEDVKPTGEDFGSLLDKFEQEQSARNLSLRRHRQQLALALQGAPGMHRRRDGTDRRRQERGERRRR